MLGQAVHFQRLGAPGHVFGGVLPQKDFAQMNFHPPRDRGVCSFSKFDEVGLISQRVSGGVDGAIEEQQKPVGLVDFAAVEPVEQITRDTIVIGGNFGCAYVAHSFEEFRAVDQIGQQQSFDDSGARSVFGNRHSRPLWAAFSKSGVGGVHSLPSYNPPSREQTVEYRFIVFILLETRKQPLINTIQERPI